MPIHPAHRGADTHKVRNIEADPRVRVLVQAPPGAMEQDGWVAADGTAVVVRGEEAIELTAETDGRYLTEVGRSAWREAFGPLLDVTMVVTPQRWQSWDDAVALGTLLERGYTVDEIGATGLRQSCGRYQSLARPTCPPR